MIHELRIYTAKPGTLEVFVDAMEQEVLPLLTDHGIPVIGAWVNEEKNEFVHIREFSDEESLKELSDTFYSSSEWNALVDRVRGYLSNREIRIIKPVSFSPIS